MSEYEAKKEAFRHRTKQYAARIIRLYRSLPKSQTEIQIIGKQLVRSGTSVAANYREASRARSSMEFIAKIELCSQEADESMLWLELLHEECGIAASDLDWLLRESNELIAIFVTMAIKVKAK